MSDSSVFAPHQSVVLAPAKSGTRPKLKFADSLPDTVAGRHGGRSGITWMVRGLLFCGQCGRLMSSHAVRSGPVIPRYYRCRSTAGGQQPCKGVIVAKHRFHRFGLDAVAWNATSGAIAARAIVLKAAAGLAVAAYFVHSSTGELPRWPEVWVGTAFGPLVEELTPREVDRINDLLVKNGIEWVTSQIPGHDSRRRKRTLCHRPGCRQPAPHPTQPNCFAECTR